MASNGDGRRATTRNSTTNTRRTRTTGGILDEFEEQRDTSVENRVHELTDRYYRGLEQRHAFDESIKRMSREPGMYRTHRSPTLVMILSRSKVELAAVGWCITGDFVVIE